MFLTNEPILSVPNPLYEELCQRSNLVYRIVHGDFTSWACSVRHYVVGIVNCHGIVIEIIPARTNRQVFHSRIANFKFEGISNCHERCDYCLDLLM